MLKLLLDRNADINATDEDGLNALHEAVSLGKLDMARLLLERGANANVFDEYERSILHHAIQYGIKNYQEFKIVKFLCESGKISSKSFIYPGEEFDFDYYLDEYEVPEEIKKMILEAKEKAEIWDRRTKGGKLVEALLRVSDTRVERGQLLQKKRKKTHIEATELIDSIIESLEETKGIDGEERIELLSKINGKLDILESKLSNILKAGGVDNERYVATQAERLLDKGINCRINTKKLEVKIDKIPTGIEESKSEEDKPILEKTTSSKPQAKMNWWDRLSEPKKPVKQTTRPVGWDSSNIGKEKKFVNYRTEAQLASHYKGSGPSIAR